MKIKEKNVKGNKGQHLVRNRKGELVKTFKTWYDEKTKIGTIQLVFKGGDGKKQKIYKQYKSQDYHHPGGKEYMPARLMMWEVIVRLWPGFKIGEHFMYMTSGHTHKVEKKPTKKKLKKRTK